MSGGSNSKGTTAVVNGGGGGNNNNNNMAELQDQIFLALLHNGGIGRIQTALRQRLDECGWSEAVREHVTRRYRSGEATTFFDVYDQLTAHMGVEGVGIDGGNNSKSKTGGGGQQQQQQQQQQQGPFPIPRSAAEAGLEVIKKELERICEFKT